ncbi:UNVERIFIED_CONTAM: hypothetical protein Slati_0868000 [Sesamum latifolium]|uniref:Uncharacterized protein n=1 Tax=Sesamum latifolium TaxID=2727402 RepID=A0AAW2XNW1_9LAMI
MIEESAASVLDYEASTSREKGKGVRRWKRKNDGAESVTASALRAPIASLGEGKGNGKMVRQSRVTYDICMNCQMVLEEGVSCTPVQPRCCNCNERYAY